MASRVGRPESMKKCMTNGDSVQTNPTDRSISPETISSTRPMPMTTYGPMYWAMLTKLPWLKKAEVVAAKEMKTITAMSGMLALRWFRKRALTRLRTLGPRFRPLREVPMIPGLRSAVSLTSLIPIVLLRPMPVLRGVIPRRRDGSPCFLFPVNGRGPAHHSVAPSRSDRDRAGVLDVLLRRGGALKPGRRRGVRSRVGLGDELQAGVRGGRRHQATGQLPQVQVDRGQEALQIGRLVDGEVDLAGRDQI